MTDLDLTTLSATRGGSRPLHGYLARPAGEGPWPGVVLVHEVFGVDEAMRRHADRLAAAGYLTLAVDLYSAGGARRCLVSTMRAMTSGQGRAFTDIETARTWLTDAPECTGRTGVIGFCMGGGFALLVSADGFDASAVNYGMIPADVDEVLRGSCPLVGSYGGRDKSFAREVPRLEAALTRLGVPHDLEVYPDAGHSFLNDEENGPRLARPLLRLSGVGPEPVAAADAWRRIEEFFDRHLRGGAPRTG